MGISWSNGRRQNHRQHHYLPPPQQPYQEPSLYPAAINPPPQHGPPPPYHPPQAPAPYTAPLPPPPSQPQPQPQRPVNPYYYQFHNQPPYYANHSNGWPRAAAARLLAVLPAPYIDHQSAKKVRNDVNVHKHTLKIEADEENPDHVLVSFVFDAVLDGSITIFYFAKEEPNCKFVPLYPEAYMPVKILFKKGLGQKFLQPSGTGIDLGFFELDDLAKPSPEEDIFPVVIYAETHQPESSNGEHLDDTVSKTSHMQITQAVLEKSNNDLFQVKVIKQMLWVDGVRYELRELFGIGNSAAEGFEDKEPEKDCVICMTEPKDTAVLPCRHMCLCSDCAKELRLQSNKCPICRQPIKELIEIKINNGDQ